MLRVPSAGRAVLAQLHAVGVVAPVLVARVVPVPALSTCPPEPSVVNAALPRHFRVLPSLATHRGQDKASRRPPSAPHGSDNPIFTLTLAHGKRPVKPAPCSRLLVS
jgi:hypothetical protein